MRDRSETGAIFYNGADSTGSLGLEKALDNRRARSAERPIRSQMP